MESLLNEEYGKIIAPGVIRFKRILPGPVEKVWAYLTESEKRAKWLAAGHFDLRPGGKTVLNFLHENLSVEDDSVPEKYKDEENCEDITGQIIAIESPRLFSFSWGETDGSHSEVTFELRPEGENVLLTLTHRKLTKDIMISVASGWHTHLGILADVMVGKSPKGFWRVHNKVEEDYLMRI